MSKPLTSRMMEVAKLIALGKCRKEIASKLNISVHTVDYHAWSIHARTCTTNPVELAHLAIAKGWVKLMWCLLVIGLCGCAQSKKTSSLIPAIPKAITRSVSAPVVRTPTLVWESVETNATFEVQQSRCWPPVWEAYATTTNRQIRVIATNQISVFRVRTWVGSQHSIWTDGSDT